MIEIKNTTASDIFVSDTGTNVPASSSYFIEPQTQAAWAKSEDKLQYILDGDLVVNDGTNDLSPSQGLAVLYGAYTEVDFDENLKFNNRLKVEVLNTGGPIIQVSSNDQTMGYLEQKVVGTTNKIVVSTLNDGGDEDLQINIGSHVFDKSVDTAANIINTPAGNIAATNVQAALNELDSEKQALSEKGQANGYASLDSGGKVPVSQLPDTVVGSVEYKGTWNANTNSPSLTTITPDKGDYYVVNVAGSTSLGGIRGWKVGDWAIYNGTAWEKVDNTDQVSSVFGRQGTVTAQSGDYTASQVTNVPAGNIAATTVQAALNELDTEKVPTTTTVSAGAGLTGGGDLSANRTISMPNVGTAGTYGSATQVPVITTDTKGRVTSVTNTPYNLTTFSNSSTGTKSTTSQTFQASSTSIVPNVAGNYIIIAHTEISCATSGVSNNAQVALGKNGTILTETAQDVYIAGSGISLASFGISGNVAMVSLVSANGTTDSFDIFYRRVNGSSVTIGSRRILAIRYS